MRRVELVLGLIFLVLIAWIGYAAYSKYPSLQKFLKALWRWLMNLFGDGGKGDADAAGRSGGGADAGLPDSGGMADLSSVTPGRLSLGGYIAPDGSLVWEQ